MNITQGIIFVEKKKLLVFYEKNTCYYFFVIMVAQIPFSLWVFCQFLIPYSLFCVAKNDVFLFFIGFLFIFVVSCFVQFKMVSSLFLLIFLLVIYSIFLFLVFYIVLLVSCSNFIVLLFKDVILMIFLNLTHFLSNYKNMHVLWWNE